MAVTAVYESTKPEQDQANASDTVSTALDNIETGENGWVDIPLTGTPHIVNTSILKTAVVLEFTGTPGLTVVVTLGDVTDGGMKRQVFLVRNETDQDLTIQGEVGGNTYTLHPKQKMRVYSKVGESGGNGLHFVDSNAWPLGFYFNGAPSDSQELMALKAPFDFTIPKALVGSVGRTGIDPASTATFSCKKNGSEFGTVQFNTSGVVTLAAASATDFVRDTDVLSIEAPSTQDSSMQNINILLIGLMTGTIA